MNERLLFRIRDGNDIPATLTGTASVFTAYSLPCKALMPSAILSEYSSCLAILTYFKYPFIRINYHRPTGKVATWNGWLVPNKQGLFTLLGQYSWNAEYMIRCVVQAVLNHTSDWFWCALNGRERPLQMEADTGGWAATFMNTLTGSQSSPQASTVPFGCYASPLLSPGIQPTLPQGSMGEEIQISLEWH